jgi:hypothetical protein
MDSLSGALNNRDVLKMMAQVGTELDPQGVGGMLGRPTSQMIERQQQGNAMELLLQALGGENNLTGAKLGPDGSIDIKSAQAQGLTPQAASSSEGSALKGEQDMLPDQMSDFDSFLDNILNGLFSNEGGA